MMYASKIILLYTLNLYSAACQLYLKKDWKKKYMQFIVCQLCLNKAVEETTNKIIDRFWLIDSKGRRLYTRHLERYSTQGNPYLLIHSTWYLYNFH